MGYLLSIFAMIRLAPRPHPFPNTLSIFRMIRSAHCRQHAFSIFLHQESLAYSLFVRYNENCRRVPDFEALNWHQVSWFSENKLHA
jgi:hypothetical protein